MNILIFGGGGFIGSAIADRLLQDGHSLRIFERPGVQPFRKFKGYEIVKWINGDFSCADTINSVVEGVDAVLHLVSTTLPKSSNTNPIYDVQSNVVASLHILDAMVAHDVKKIVFISSGGTVYGNPKYLPIDEAHPTDPVVSYGITKLAIEKYLQMYSALYGIRTVILRVANPYGERQRSETAQGAVGVFLANAIKGVPIQLWGDGSVTRDYIHVSDVADSFVASLSYNGSHSVFNIGSGKGTSLTDLIGEIENALGRSVEVNYFEKRNFDVPVNYLNIELAQAELNWRPAVSLSKGLAATAKWMQSQFFLK